MKNPLPQLMLELAYWLPLVVLVLVSLAMVALKRIPSLPSWAERIRTRPFYMISFPIVTLIVGVELLLFIVRTFRMWFYYVSPSDWFIFGVGSLVRLSLIWPRETFIALASGCAVCVALVTSFSAVRHELSYEDREDLVANKANDQLKGLTLAIAFIWTWLSLRYVIIHLETARFMTLRII
ncbi:hypothetical protein [Methylosinus sp. Ce-a6]|uniref:hypothetical protein n=1 Tax=Methylosinus sp. Ce-a6 TaxID=2172005 RepID=UPI00135677AC|nr:hypothetical protein [Methylosinus sp. Ce-a6]